MILHLPQVRLTFTSLRTLACLQVITPDLNRSVLELLIKIRDLQQSEHGSILISADLSGGSSDNLSVSSGEVGHTVVAGQVGVHAPMGEGRF